MYWGKMLENPLENWLACPKKKLGKVSSVNSFEGHLTLNIYFKLFLCIVHWLELFEYLDIRNLMSGSGYRI